MAAPDPDRLPALREEWEINLETSILSVSTIKNRAASNFLNSSCCLTVKNSAVGPAVTSSVGDVTLGDSEKSPFPPSPVITSECILSDGH